LKNEKIVPSAQTVRQNGRLAVADQTTNSERMPSLIQKNFTSIERMLSSSSDQGRPAIRIPSGQSFENQGSWKT
jgi:hypothetical protein